MNHLVDPGDRERDNRVKLEPRRDGYYESGYKGIN
jgi:hypothetical protein